jgi:hypothetical protein
MWESRGICFYNSYMKCHTFFINNIYMLFCCSCCCNKLSDCEFSICYEISLERGVYLSNQIKILNRSWEKYMLFSLKCSWKGTKGNNYLSSLSIHVLTLEILLIVHVHIHHLHICDWLKNHTFYESYFPLSPFMNTSMKITYISLMICFCYNSMSNRRAYIYYL